MHEEEITFDQAYLSYFRVICLYIMSRLPCDRYTAEDIAAIDQRMQSIHDRVDALSSKAKDSA